MLENDSEGPAKIPGTTSREVAVVPGQDNGNFALETSMHRDVAGFSNTLFNMATLGGILCALFALFLTAGPNGEPGWMTNLVNASTQLGLIVTEGGWSILGLALALLTIAVTAAAIVGLRDPDEKSWRRRFLIMSIAETFTTAAAALLAGCTATAVIGICGRAATDQATFHPSQNVSLFFIPAVAVILWFCVRVAYRHLGQISLNDRDALLKETNAISQQVTAYKEAASRLDKELDTFGVSGNASLRKTIIASGVASLLMIFIASLFCASIVLLSGSVEENQWGRFWGAFIGTSGLNRPGNHAAVLWAAASGNEPEFSS